VLTFFENIIIMIMNEMQYSSTALSLLVNPSIPHWNNGTVCHTCIFIVWKEETAMFNPSCSSTNQQLFKKNFCNQSRHYENYGLLCVPSPWKSVDFLVGMWWLPFVTKIVCTDKSVVHEECIACAAVWQKAPFGLKWRQTVKKSSS